MSALNLSVCQWVICIALITHPLSAPIAAQRQLRVIEPGVGIINPESLPLELIEIRVRSEQVKIGHPFRADDDWLAGLSFKFKNISRKPISYISLSLSLPETRSREARLSFSLNYGRAIDSATNSAERSRIMPGAEVELRLSEAEYERFKRYIQHRIMLSELSRIVISLVYVEMSDGTTWTGGVLRRPVRIIPARPDAEAI